MAESLLAVLLLRVQAGFSQEWTLANAALILWTSFLAKFFTPDLGGDSNLQAILDKLQFLTEPALAAYLVSVYLSNESSKQQICLFVASVYLLVTLGTKKFPKAFTFQDAFTLAIVAVNYAKFSLENLMG